MIRFGPSGNSAKFYSEGYKASTQAPKWLAEQGLNAYEYSFGKGINISDAKAREIGEQAKLFDVAVSVHAPYYINLANPSDEMASKSFDYILRSCAKCREFGGERIVFHPSTVGKLSRREAVELTSARMRTLAEIIRENNMDGFTFCPETMGKINQIGGVEEVAEFCKTADFFVPTIDFGHINARTYGSLKTEEDYEHIIVYLLNAIGTERTNRIHIHFSKIEYSAGGEVRHLTFADTLFGPEFEPLAKILKKYSLNPVVICESDGTQSDDALYMKKTFESLV